MEVFRNTGEEGVLTICLDGGEPVNLNFKNTVHVSVSYPSKDRNVADDFPSLKVERTSLDTAAEKVKNDPLDEELNGFIQRVKHSESGNGNLFSDTTEDFFLEKDDNATTANDDKVKVEGLNVKNEMKVADDDESTMDLEDDYNDVNESAHVDNDEDDMAEEAINSNDESKDNDNIGEDNHESSVAGSAVNVKDEMETSASTPSKEKTAVGLAGKDGNTESVEVNSEKKEDKSTKPAASTLEGKYMRMKGKRILTVYKCNICNKEFSDSYMLSIHQRAENTKVMCSMCDLECMSKANLIIHEHLMHSKAAKVNGKMCPVCSKQFLKHSEILNHIRSDHTNEGLYRCCRCRTLFQNYQTFQFHLSSHRVSSPGNSEAKSTPVRDNRVKEAISKLVQSKKTRPVSGTLSKKTPRKVAETVSPTSKPKAPKQLRSLMNYQAPKPLPKLLPKPVSTPKPATPLIVPKPVNKKSVPRPANTQSASRPANTQSASRPTNSNNASRQANTLKRRMPISTQSLLPTKKRPLQPLSQLPATSAKPLNLPPKTKHCTVKLVRARLPQKSQAAVAAKKKLTSARRSYTWDKLWKCHFCERVFRSKGEYINHKKPSRITQMCKECGFTSTSKALYLIHEYQKHTNRHNDRYTLINDDLHCHICEDPIALNEVLNHVMSKHTGEHPYECCVCKEPSTAYEDWVKHGKTHLRSKDESTSLATSKLILSLTVKTDEGQSNDKMFCNLCKVYYPTEKDFIRHHKSETQKRECEVCRLLCYTEGGYIVHKYISHGLSPGEGKEAATTIPSTSISGDFKLWHEDDALNDSNTEETKCPCCSESFPVKDILNHVMNTHTQESPYKCCACKTPISDLDQYIDHCDFHLGKKLYNRGTQRCLICGLRFDSRIRLSRHKVMHKPSCPYCQMEFNSKALLDVHLKNLHTNDMTACGFCGKLFADSNQLAEHERNHYFYKKSQCPDCGVMVTNVNKHLARKHPKPDTQFLCNLCGQKFPLRCDLARHLSKHSNDRRHECDICKKTFKRAAGLRRHAQSHLQNRKFHECHICGKKCSQRNNLSVHMRVHASVKAFTCEHCGQGFNYNQSLQTHIRKKHTSGAPPPPPPPPLATNREPNTRSRAATATASSTAASNPVPPVINTQTSATPAIAAAASFQEHPGYPDSSQHYYPDPSGYNVPVNAFQRSYSDLINTIVRSEHETQQGAQQQGYPVFYPQF